MATNDVLDRLEALLVEFDEQNYQLIGPACQLDRAMRQAAPALIRLARAVLAVDDWTTKTDYEMKLACNEKSDAIKALGEVRL